MPAPSLTYTLTNGSTADASQVMQNFNDLLNGISDGTKDLSISALTAAGTATLNGDVNLGNSSSDSITITGSLTSNIIPSTTGTRSLGSGSLGFLDLYLAASGDVDTARIVAAAHAADRVYTVPDAGADASFVMTQGTQTISGTKTFDGQLIGKGTATNDSAAAGYIGEYIESVVTASQTAAASGSYLALTSITLTAGDWDISATSVCLKASTTVFQDTCRMVVGTTSASATGTTLGESTQMFFLPSSLASTSISGGSISSIRVSLTGSTTYYLNVFASYTTAAPSFRGNISARRVR